MCWPFLLSVLLLRFLLGYCVNSELLTLSWMSGAALAAFVSQLVNPSSVSNFDQGQNYSSTVYLPQIMAPFSTFKSNPHPKQGKDPPGKRNRNKKTATCIMKILLLLAHPLSNVDLGWHSIFMMSLSLTDRAKGTHKAHGRDWERLYASWL